MQPESNRPAAVTAIANFSDVSFIDILDFQSKAIYSENGPFRPATTPPSLPTLSPKLTRIPELASSSCTAAGRLCLFCRKCLSRRAFSGNNVSSRPDHCHSPATGAPQMASGSPDCQERSVKVEFLGQFRYSHPNRRVSATRWNCATG